MWWWSNISRCYIPPWQGVGPDVVVNAAAWHDGARVCTALSWFTGSLGAVPLDVDIKSRMLTYLARLCVGDKLRISNTIYS